MLTGFKRGFLITFFSEARKNGKVGAAEVAAKRKSIATRWFINSFGIIAVIILVVIVGVYLFARNYYYSSVSRYLRSEASVIQGVLTRFYENSSSDYSEELRSTIEHFEKKMLWSLWQ